jgi:hypothetical protein
MTKGEAKNLTILLRWALGLTTYRLTQDLTEAEAERLCDAQARAAALMLAQRASGAYPAGVTANEVARAWPAAPASMGARNPTPPCGGRGTP